MAERLADEIMDASNRGCGEEAGGRPPAMAEANKAFAHYRW